MIVWRYALRFGVVLAGLAGTLLAVAAPAQAAFTTQLGGLPERFTAGGEVRTVSAVVSRTGAPGGCVKVRWSLVLRVEGLRLDQVRLDRVEETGSFPVEVRTEGDVARLTDRQLDPGTLCPDRTVTARYRLAFAGDVTRGRITLAAEAYDARLRLLARQTATRTVVGAGAAATPAAPDPDVSTPAPAGTPPEPSATASDPGEPAAGPVDEETPGPVEEPAAAAPAAGAGRPVSTSGASGRCRPPSCSVGSCCRSGSDCCCGCGGSCAPTGPTSTRRRRRIGCGGRSAGRPGGARSAGSGGRRPGTVWPPLVAAGRPAGLDGVAGAGADAAPAPAPVTSRTPGTRRCGPGRAPGSRSRSRSWSPGRRPAHRRTPDRPCTGCAGPPAAGAWRAWGAPGTTGG